MKASVAGDFGSSACVPPSDSSMRRTDNCPACKSCRRGHDQRCARFVQDQNGGRLLALLLHRVLRMRLKAHGNSLSPQRALALLRQIQHLQVHIDCQPATRLSQISAEQRDLLKSLQFPAPADANRAAWCKSCNARVAKSNTYGCGCGTWGLPAECLAVPRSTFALLPAKSNNGLDPVPANQCLQRSPLEQVRSPQREQPPSLPSCRRPASPRYGAARSFASKRYWTVMRSQPVSWIVAVPIRCVFGVVGPAR